jgi:acyl-CoA reductase-like NAD-dependent aldehyde dehydrogenase
MLSTAQARHKAGRLPEIQRIEILQKLADLVAAEHEDFSRLIAKREKSSCSAATKSANFCNISMR